MRNSKVIRYILSATIFGITCAIIATISFRVELAKKIMTQLLSSHQLTSQFKIEEFSLHHLKMSDIVLNDKIKIPKIEIVYGGWLRLEPRVRQIVAEVDDLDIPTVNQILQQQSSNVDSTSPPVTFKSLSDSCSNFADMKIQLSLKNLTWHSAILPIHFNLEHAQKSENYLVDFSGATDTEHHSDLISIKKSKFNGQLLLSCKADHLQLQISKVLVHLQSLVSQNPKIDLPNIDLQIDHGLAKIDESNQLTGELASAFNLIAHTQQGPLHGRADQLQLNFTSPLKDFSQISGNVSAQRFSVRHGQELSVDHLSIQAKQNSALKQSVGDFIIHGLGAKDDKSQTLISGINTSGQFKAQPPSVDFKLNLSDATKTLDFKDAKLALLPETSHFSLVLPENKSTIRLNSSLGNLFPFLKKHMKSASGKISLHGKLEGNTQSVKGPLSISIENADVDTEYGKATGIKLKHVLLEYPTFKSGKDNSLSISEVTAGPMAKNISLTYNIQELHQIDVRNLNFKYEGASIEASPFTINPIGKSLEGFTAKITHLELEKLLALALKDTVSASGMLSGHIKLHYKNKIPTIEGDLAVDAPGWIRYRTGPGQKPAIQVTDNPMDILNGYLYDFAYQTLDVNVKTDETYKTMITLHTFGHNPNYVKGKPLKLKINLEQNLLAAFQSMMLTYDLPSKLKEKLEGVEAK